MRQLALTHGKEFAYDQIMLEEVVEVDGTYDRPNMNLTKYLTDNKFRPLHQSSNQWLTQLCTTMAFALSNTKDSVHLAIERNTTGLGKAKCHIFTISDTQMNIMEKQLQAVQY